MTENTKIVKPLELAFFFDYQSPYSYFAAHQIKPLCARYQVMLHWCPVVLGAVFQACNTVPPAEKPHRKAYMLQDLNDLANFYQLPYVPRDEFVFNSILALRATLATDEKSRDQVVLALFDAVFAKGHDLSDKRVVLNVLNGSGLDGGKVLENAVSTEVKAALRTNTDAAIKKGVFGAPTMVVNNKRFWGQDRLPLLERMLQKNQISSNPKGQQ